MFELANKEADLESLTLKSTYHVVKVVMEYK